MRRRGLRNHTASQYTHEQEDIARLWILRLLVPLGGHRGLLRETCFSDDSIAETVSLGHWLEPDGPEFNQRKAFAELRRLHTEAERSLRSAAVPAVLRSNTLRLAEMIGLDEPSCRILELVVLLHNMPQLEEASGLLGPISTSRLYTVISVLVGLPEQQIKEALSTRGQLARSGLVKLDHGSAQNLTYKLDLLSSSLPGRMISSVEDPLTLLREMIAPCEPPSLDLADYQHIQRDLDVVVPYLRQAVAQRRKGVNIYIHGSPGTGKTQFARVLAQSFGCELFEVAREDSDGDAITGNNRLRALRAAQSILGTRQSLLLFDEVEDIFGDGESFWGKRSTAEANKGWLNRMLEDNPVPTMWLSNSICGLEPAFVRRFDMVFELPVPPRRQRERIVTELCADLLPADAIARLAHAEALAPAVVERAAHVVSSIRSELTDEQVPAALERLIGNTLTTQGHPPLKKNDPNQLPSWYDPRFINTSADLNALAEGLSRNKSGRVCLYGPPGTGKTAFGRWLADRLELPLLVKRASDLLSMWVGGSEKNIAKAFREAECEGALLLIDEMDSFLQDRRNAERSWEVTQVNEMLTQMESFPGIFIASTNLMNNLDQAALRRFDLKLKFDYLLPEQAWEMFVRQCAALDLPQPEPELRHRLASLGVLTPGDYAAAARQHRFRPFATAYMLLDALGEECAVKEDGRRHSIGFVH